MPYYDFGQHREHEPYEDGSALLQALWTLYDAGILPAYRELLQENMALAAHNFGVWLVFPPEVQGDDAAIQRYSEMITSMARYFISRGNQEPALMLGGAATNPMTAWDEAFPEFEARMKEYDFAAAAEVLQATLADMRRYQGPGVDLRRPYAHERLAWLFFLRGDGESAELHAQAAWHDFQALGLASGLLGISRRLADIAKMAQDRDKFKHWMITHTNLLVEAGHTENAAAVRRLNGIEPEEGIISLPG